MLRFGLWAAVALIAVWAHLRHRTPRDGEVPRVLALLGAAGLASILLENLLLLGSAPLLAMAQAPLALVTWGAIVWLVAFGSRRRDLVVRVPLIVAACLVGANGGPVPVIVALSTLAIWRADWVRVLPTLMRFRVAILALALFVLAVFGFVRGGEIASGPVRDLGIWSLSLTRVAAWVAFYSAFLGFTRDPSLGIRRVSRRLAVSHVLVVAVPILLLGALWTATTILGVNGDRAAVAARVAREECAELRDALATAVERPDAARVHLGELVHARTNSWPGLRAWLLGPDRIERIAGEPLEGEEDLDGWAHALGRLPASGAVLLPAGTFIGAVARSRADSSWAVVALADADSVLARQATRITGARLFLRSNRLTTGNRSFVIDDTPRRRDRSRGAVAVDDSLELARARAVTRRLGLPDSVVRISSSDSPGGVRFSSGGDTLDVSENPVRVALLQGHATLRGVALGGRSWTASQQILSAEVAPMEILAGMYRLTGRIPSRCFRPCSCCRSP